MKTKRSQIKASKKEVKEQLKTLDKEIDNLASKVASTYQQFGNTITASTVGSTSVTTPNIVWDIPPLQTKSKEEQEKEIAEIASTLENLIADYLPDADKQVPVDIALAVTKYLYQKNAPIISPEVDSAIFMSAEQTIADRIKNMSMEEYAKIRHELLGRHAGVQGPVGAQGVQGITTTGTGTTTTGTLSSQQFYVTNNTSGNWSYKNAKV